MFPALHFECACFDEGRGFAGDGFFNPPEGEIEFMADAATDRLYEKVYGEKPEKDEDGEAA